MASIVLRKPSNMRKNRINPEKLFLYDNFAFPDFVKKALSGAFRDNIRLFLHDFAEIQNYCVNGMPVWCTSLFTENDVVCPLYTLEETVQDSPTPFCNYCELSGWGHHFVCKRKYHFIIPEKADWNEPLDVDFAELESLKLYGLVHCNGFGHLVCIHGLRYNFNFFGAEDSVEFWDRLCTLLRVRSISADHVSRRGSVELNLIHGIAYGKSWLAKWGYRFNGEITEDKHNAAIRYLSKLSLDLIISISMSNRNANRIKSIIDVYRKCSTNPLSTISDLLKFMLALDSRIDMVANGVPKLNLETGETIPMGFEKLVDSMRKSCRWPARRLEHVLLVIVDLLKEHKNENLGRDCGVSRQQLRDGARRSIGDTGLIDFVLKSINCFTVENQIIRRATNPFSRLAEFTIQECSRGYNLSVDVWTVCENVVAMWPETKLILECDHFVKDWPIAGRVVGQGLVLECKVLPSFDELEGQLGRRLSPGEVVVVKPWMTVADLKMVAQGALKDTYCVMDEFEVSQIGGLRKIENDKVVGSVFELGAQVWVRGRGLDLGTRLRHEDGGWKMKG
ncbi:hypothetical protein SASPL_142937 [Salvia splendens]|uniref:PHD finger protein MALE MEIOCYTE DEATH 1 n=1 Tax=Salvia splendens TaxID=180675 RepID=A0A8X8WJZ8_SALSN|nr:PHD finger protein At2g01810-like [Salvia splendens]KAG6396780.1 hypothetical protein SASPL_142937 [Salvia splendens]